MPAPRGGENASLGVLGSTANLSTVRCEEPIASGQLYSFRQTECLITPTPAPSCTVQFADVPAYNTFYPFVRCLACQSIISGYPCGGTGEPCNANYDPYFRPNNYVTRGQLAKIVSEAAEFAEQVPSSQWTFTDVPYGSSSYVLPA
jgi:hypothetical protein